MSVQAISRARADAMLSELLQGYSAKIFQRKLNNLVQKQSKSLHAEEKDDVAGRWELAKRVHGEVLERYGYKADEHMSSVMESVMTAYPQLLDKVRSIYETLHLKELPIEVKVAAETPAVKDSLLTKETALKIHEGLLAAATRSKFQKMRSELQSKSRIVGGVEFEGRLNERLCELQKEVLQNNGYPSSVDGLRAFHEAMTTFRAEPEILSLSKQIHDMVYGAFDPIEVELALAAPGGQGIPPRGWRQVVLAFLREQLVQLSSWELQNKVLKLKESTTYPAKRKPSDGLSTTGSVSEVDATSREELLTQVQMKLLAPFGLPISKKGVAIITNRSSEYLHEPEVASYADAVNFQLGRSWAECRLMRERMTPKQLSTPAGPEDRTSWARKFSCETATTAYPSSPAQGRDFAPSETDSMDQLVLPAAVDEKKESPWMREKVQDSSSSDSSSSPRVQAISKKRALALQAELLAAFTAARFQKKLNELSRAHEVVKNGKTNAYRTAFRQLVRREQFQILPRYAFDATDEGVNQMLLAFEEWKEDNDIFVNAVAIKEALFAPSSETFERTSEGGVRTVQKTGTKDFVMKLLRCQLVSFSHPAVQRSVQTLQIQAASKAKRSPEEDAPDGYYRLEGRAELALEIQKLLLPRFGFEGSRKGVQEMILHCSKFINDPEVAALYNGINTKLGMSPAACQRFRQVASSLAPADLASAASPSEGGKVPVTQAGK